MIGTLLDLSQQKRKKQALQVANAGFDPPVLRADRVHIQQILLKLIRNAEESVRICGAGKPRVSVGAAIEFCVRDNGAGFTAQALDRAFEPFLTTKPDGSGRGLAISQSIVDAFAGTISVANSAEGGATVRFTIPLAA